jgi:glutaredoxin
MSKLLVAYTMKGCHWCTEFKKQLKENKIKFKERDIEKYEEEYNLFVEVTGNDFVPAFMIVDTITEDAKLFAPDRDFQDINEAVGIIKNIL